MKLGYIIRYSDKGVDGIMPVISTNAQFYFCSHGERLPRATWHMASDDELKAARRALALRSQDRAVHKLFHPTDELAKSNPATDAQELPYFELNKKGC